MRGLSIRRDLKVIKKYYRKCLDSSETCGVYEWLCDNFYLYEREGKWAKHELAKVNKFVIEDDGKRLREICRRLCRTYNGITSTSTVEMIRNEGLSVFEIDFFPAAFKAELLRLIAETIKEDSIENRNRIAYATKELKNLSGVNIYDFSEKVSAIENTLLMDPGNVYPYLSKETRALYRRRIAILSKNSKKGEKEYANGLIEKAKLDCGHIGGFLNFGLHNTVRGKFFIAFEIVAAALLSYLFYRLSGNAVYAFAMHFPLWALSSKFSDKVALNNVLPEQPLRMSKDSPMVQDSDVLIVVSTLLPNANGCSELEKQLRFLYFSNKGSNIKVCVLADMKPAPILSIPQDDADLSAFEHCISSLNKETGSGFIGIVRNRAFSTAQNNCIGPERKRGAISDLVAYIKGEKRNFRLICGDCAGIGKTKYLMLLDSDTDLPMDMVYDLLSVAVHPLNRKRYGIFAPSLEIKVEDAKKTRFAELFSGNAGINSYNNVYSERYQDLFGNSIFSGKGLVSVDSYYLNLMNAFPPDVVLSHDILEGEMLKTMLVSDTCVVEGFPSNEMSYFSREDRWIRGDFQNISFILSKNLSKISKYKLMDNLRRELTPIMLVTSLILSGFISRPIADLTVIIILLAIDRPADAIILGQRAFINLTAAVKGLYRRFVSHQNTLSWMTFAQAESNSSFWKIFDSMLPSVLVGVVLLLLPGLLKIFGALFVMNPLFGYFTGKRSAAKKNPSNDQIVSYAKATWNYYATFVGKKDNYLPPDNVQESPVLRIAHRTSPTNIGFLLVSTLSACDFGFIDVDEMSERLDKTITSIERLKKYKGNLFNWYDTVTLETLEPKYVSTVDSGNFLCLLTTLREGLSQYKYQNGKIPNLIERCSTLIDETDISFLYDKDRKLFYVGYNTAEEKFSDSYYDLLMSEARMTSYYAIARRQVPKEHWTELSRIMSKTGRRFGPLSWTGTMFEYYLPHVLLPVYDGTLEEEALSYCEFCQRKSAKGSKIPFGISESGFYEFDKKLNYQYKAHGVQKLGLGRNLDKENVVSPYSTFLLLPHNSELALKNLKILENMNMTGQYGFYEAIDFTPWRIKNQCPAIVRSYMAHHVGMSMLSLTNAAFDNIMQKRFMSDNEMLGAKYLLMEKTPKNVQVFKDVSGRREPDRPPRGERSNVIPIANAKGKTVMQEQESTRNRLEKSL